MKKVAFKGGLLIDGTGAEPVVNSLVLTEDDKIAYAGADKEIGPDYEVVDITGKTIMPGLIDSHLHFSGNLTDDDSDWVLEDVVQKTVVAVQQAHECLENGLTTVGEISRSGIQIRNMVEAGVMKGPRVVATGLADTGIPTSFPATITTNPIHGLSVWTDHGICARQLEEDSARIRMQLKSGPQAAASGAGTRSWTSTIRWRRFRLLWMSAGW